MWKNIIVPIVALLGTLLGIFRYSGTPGENLAIKLWLIILACLSVFWICRYLFKQKGPWIKRWYRIYMIARSVARLNPNERSLDRMVNWIKRHAPERPAEASEVNKTVCGAPILQALEEKDRIAKLDRFRDEILKTSLIWFRWHEVERHEFDFDFDSFRFLNPDSPAAGLDLIKHHIKHDILGRFTGQQFHTIVYILRGKSNHRMARFFEELKIILPCDDFIGFPLDPVRRERDAVLADELLKACAGKSILLVEPLFTDGGLDDAYETITDWGGIINGVVVMFEVKGIDPKKLTNYAKLQQKSGQEELRGQIVLDLKSPLTETI